MDLIGKIKKKVVEILTSRPVFQCIRLFNGKKVRSYGSLIDTSDENITEAIAANIFWNIYEKAELRSVHKYLKPGLPIIEIGSSLGVVSALIGKIKAHEDKLICFEANPSLIPTIKKNLELNKIQNFKIFNKAIGPANVHAVYFSKAISSLNGKISLEVSGEKVEVTTLRQVLEQENIHDFSLIADIEGAEVYLIFEQIEIFKNCRLTILELHNTRYQDKYYAREDLDEIFRTKSGMKLTSRFRHVFVYERH